MSWTEFVVKPTENIARPFSIILETPKIVGIIAWVLGLGLLAVGLYLAPTVTALALAAFGLGLPLLLLAWFRPEFGLLALIFLTSSFLLADTVDLRLPVGGLDLRDLTLMGMLGVLILQGLIRKKLKIPWWPVSGPLLVFLGFAVFSALYALFFQGVKPNWALRDLRAFSFYAVFFVTGWAITRRRQLAIALAGLFLIADLTAGIVLLQQTFGIQQRLLAAMSYSNWYMTQQETVSDGFGAVRIVPPGHLLVFFMMVIAFCLMLSAQHNRRLCIIAALQFVYLNVGLLLTYTRAQWVAAAIALGLIFIVLLPTHKAQFARYLVVGIPVLLLAYSLFIGTALQESIDNVPVVKALTARALSIFTPVETLESLSLEWRLFEAEEALRSISERPLLGVGLGNFYRDLTLLRGEASGRMMGSLAPEELYRFTRYLHSSYLAIAVKMGLPALIGFLWFCAAFLITGWQLYRNLSKGYLKGIVLAVLAGFLGLLQWSILHSHFVEADSTPTVGLMVGLIASVQYIQGCEAGSSSPLHDQLRSRIVDSELEANDQART